jgi:uncharacterized protein
MKYQKSKLDRRSFIKRGVSGVAAISVVPSLVSAVSTKQDANNPKIITRKLGNTGLELPVVSMGVMRADNPNLIRAAYNRGIVHFDTAHSYQHGRNEEMCGKVFKSIDRDSFVISTKIPGNKFDTNSGEWEIKNNPKEFLEKFEISLKRLQMDYVDILYLHATSNKEEAVEEGLLELMVKLKEQGKTRFLAVSTHRNEPEVIQAAIDSEIYDVVLTAYNFKQDHSEKVGKAIEKAAKAGLGVIAMKTQAGVFWDEEKKHKINMKAALKWTLQNPYIHTTIPGFQTFDQMDENIGIMEDLQLSIQEVKDLKLGAEMGLLGLYCNQCENCNSQCDKNIDIPTMMRSYMYAFGYNNFAQAKETLNSVNIKSLPCVDCNECEVSCTAGFNVKEKLNRIYEIKNIPDRFLV